MNEERGLQFIKDFLEWIRNVAFGLGLLAVAAAVSFQDWALSPRLTAYGISATLGIAAILYLILATLYFVIRHEPAKGRKAARGVWNVGAIVVLVGIAEISALVVLHHAAWLHKHEQVSVDHAAASSNSG